MPDVVNGNEQGLRAAEYVLGTLDPDERAQAHVLLGADAGFAGMVRVWERRLGELHQMVEPVEPEPQLWARISDRVAKLKPAAPAPAAPAVSPTVMATPSPPPVAPPSVNPAAPAGFAPPPAVPAPAAPPLVPSAPPPTPQGIAFPEPAVSFEDRWPERTAEAARLPDAVPRLSSRTEPARVETGRDVLVEGKPASTMTLQPLRTEDGRVIYIERRRGYGFWRGFALAMTVVALLLGLLNAGWVYFPEQLPPALRPPFRASATVQPPPPRVPPRPPQPSGPPLEE